MTEVWSAPELLADEYSLKMKWSRDRDKVRTVQGDRAFIMAHILTFREQEAIKAAAIQVSDCSCGVASDEAGDKLADALSGILT
jgi:hypothetical protein